MNRRSRLLLIVTWAGVLLALLCAAVARPLSRHLGERLLAIVLRVGQGKISNAETFLAGRMLEAALLLGLAAILILLLMACWRFWRARPSGWAPLSVCVFVAVNIWLAVAMTTGSFWLALYTGRATSNQTQWELKRALLSEHNAPRQVLLLGSSQTQAQIDERLLNRELGNLAWFTELHFPGSHGLDLLLVLRRLRGEPGEDIVCYLSEYYFYSGRHSTTAPYFLRFGDISVLRKLGWGESFQTRNFLMGFLSDVLPVFACREPLAHRLLGVALASFGQQVHDSGLEANLEERAKIAAEGFKVDAVSELQKRSFREFVNEAVLQERRLILLEGSVNPLLSVRIPEEVRTDFAKFLRSIAREHSNVVLISAGSLPPQPPAAYSDLTHVTEAAQEAFSRWFGSQVRALLLESEGSGK